MGDELPAGQPMRADDLGLPHHSSAAAPDRAGAGRRSSSSSGVWARHARQATSGDSAAERKRLVARREKLFQDLVRLEHDHRRGRVDAARYAHAREELLAVARERLRRARQRRTGPEPAKRAASPRGDASVSFDFDRVELTDSVASLRPPQARVARLAVAAARRDPRPARSERRGQVDAARHAGHAGRPHQRHHQLRRHDGAAGGAAIRGRIGVLAHELHLYPELTARQNLEFFARAAWPRRDRRSSRRARVGRSRRSRRRSGVVVLARHAAAAGARARAAAPAAARAARRAVHRPRRPRGAHRRRRGCSDSRRPARSSCWRPTTWMWPTGSITRMAVVRAGRLLVATRRRHRRAPAVSRARGGGVMFFQMALLVLQEGLRDRAEELRDPLDDAVLRRGVRRDLLFRVREGRAGRRRTRRPASCGLRSPSPGTLALGRTFERERYGETLKALLLAPAPRPAIYLGKLLGIITLLFATEVLLVPMVAFLFNAPFFARPLLLVALLGLGTIGYAAVGHAVRRHARAGADARRDAADSAVSDYDTGDHCRRAGHVGAAGVAGRRAGGDAVDRAARVLRRGVRHAVVVDVRAADDGVDGGGTRQVRSGQARRRHMRKLFVPVLVVTAAMFAYSPIAIANAPYESTMRLVQKIFYFHFPAWMALTVVGDGLHGGQRDLSVQGQCRAPTGSPPRPPKLPSSSGCSGWSAGRSGAARRGASGGSGTRG